MAERARADLAEHLNEEINHRGPQQPGHGERAAADAGPQERTTGISRLREAVARIRTFVDIHEKATAVGVERVDLREVIRQVSSTLCAALFRGRGGVQREGAPGCSTWWPPTWR